MTYYAFMRQSFGSKSIIQQRNEITTFALEMGIKISKEVIEYSPKNLSAQERSGFQQFIRSLSSSDRIVVSELTILSALADDIVKVVTCMVSRGIEAVIANTNQTITKDTPLKEFLPHLDDIGGAQKNAPKIVGRPKGSKSSSKFDAMYHEIIEMLSKGYSVSLISRELNVSRSSLKDYIESRDIKEIVSSSIVSQNKLSSKQLSDRLIICPFEK